MKDFLEEVMVALSLNDWVGHSKWKLCEVEAMGEVTQEKEGFPLRRNSTCQCVVAPEGVRRKEKPRSYKDLCTLVRSLDFIPWVLSPYAEIQHCQSCVLGWFFNSDEENRFLRDRYGQECCQRERVGISPTYPKGNWWGLELKPVALSREEGRGIDVSGTECADQYRML